MDADTTDGGDGGDALSEALGRIIEEDLGDLATQAEQAEQARLPTPAPSAALSQRDAACLVALLLADDSHSATDAAGPLRSPGRPPAPRRQLSRASLLQRERRARAREADSSTQLNRGRHALQCSRHDLAGALDGVIQLRVGSIAPIPTGQGRTSAFSFQTLLRTALAPTHVGRSALQSLMYQGEVSTRSITRARVRIAAALRAMTRARLTDLIRDLLENAVKIARGRTHMDHLPTEVVPGIDPSADRMMAPFVFLANWRWAGASIATPMPPREDCTPFCGTAHAPLPGCACPVCGAGDIGSIMIVMMSHYTHASAQKFKHTC